MSSQSGSSPFPKEIDGRLVEGEAQQPVRVGGRNASAMAPPPEWP